MTPPPRSHGLSWFGPPDAPFLVPARTASASARSEGQGRPPGRRGFRAFLDPREPGRTLLIRRALTGSSRARRASAARLLAALLAAASLAAEPQGASCAPSAGVGVEGAIDEAARRFGLPSAWIRAVVRAESGGRADALSPKGAMGLMQLMPGTWREMRAELSLGDDPFVPRDNILAGAAYLRRLYDAYGRRGFLAAYNAGPGRYARHLAGGGPLPAETVRYVARVSAEIAGPVSDPALAGRGWRGSSLFPEVSAGRPTDLAASRAETLLVDRQARVRP